MLPFVIGYLFPSTMIAGFTLPLTILAELGRAWRLRSYIPEGFLDICSSVRLIRSSSGAARNEAAVRVAGRRAIREIRSFFFIIKYRID